MRKRAQLRETPSEPKHIKTKPKTRQTRKNPPKKMWTTIALIGIFFMVLLLNTAFNVTSDAAINHNGETVAEKFYLSGPDPYYNMRLVEETLRLGEYPYYTYNDPLLNYPLGRSGSRAPLLNMLTIGFSRMLLPFMEEVDAVGYAMQLIPALFGALIIFPVYLIGNTLFNKKVGLVAALLIALIPIHIGSGHGSAYSLFDHDSLNLLLFMLTYLFVILALLSKNIKRSLIYAALGGVSLGALSLVWVQAQFLYAVIGLYAIIQMLVDIIKNKQSTKVPLSLSVTLALGYLLYLPVQFSRSARFDLDVSLFVILAVIAFGVIYLFLNRKKIPWIISLPVIFSIGAAGIVFLLFVPKLAQSFPFLGQLQRLSDILGGIGIYGTKVAETIAEASTYNISRTWMSYGPVLFGVALVGILFLIYYYLKEKEKNRVFLLVIVVTLVSLWLTSTAGRFLNDLVPFIALLAGWLTISFVVTKIDYKQMLRNIRGAGGGFHGIRRGISFSHIFGIIFIVIVLLLPNAFLAFDGAVPGIAKETYFGSDHQSGYGLSVYKETYWMDAFDWLNDQDLEIADPADRPAFISWWDYGFYEVAAGGHPTVADNFQDGIPPAANFHTATGEDEAVAVWIARILEGERRNNDGVFSSETDDVLRSYLGENDTANISMWVKDPYSAPSYNAPIGAEYDETLSQQYRVGEQYEENAMYHDVSETLNTALDEEEITNLYLDLIDTTGLSIRYYGVEGYDRQIFNIFAFLGDKSILLPASRSLDYNAEDDFVNTIYEGYKMNPDGTKGPTQTWTAQEVSELPEDERQYVVPTNQATEYKDAYFDTMFYKVFVGGPPKEGAEGGKTPSEQQLPCYLMKHFYAKYISPYPYPGGGRNYVAVVMAKYYAGARINGTISVNNTQMQYVQTIVFDEFGIPHDNMLTDADGSFSVIAPAGNITLQFSFANEVILDEITFNNTDSSSEFSPITEDEGMRRGNYTRVLNISVDMANVNGYVYEDVNENGSYEPDIDIPLSGIEMRLEDEFGLFASPEPIVTDATGYYSFSELFPSKYTVLAIDGEYTLHSESVVLQPGNRSYNISKPQPGSVSGTVFIDENDDGTLTDGEEQADVAVDLYYTKYDDSLLKVETLTADTDGEYMFESLVPGTYILNATITNATTQAFDYIIEEEITIADNETKEHDLALELATVQVTGVTTHQGTRVGDISITFAPDTTLENNTAQQGSATSDTTTGVYSANLKPGAYTISVTKMEGTTKVYSYTGALTLTKGMGTTQKNIPLTKESVTVSGVIHDQNTNPVTNLTLTFSRDTTVENNTALPTETTSADNGTYTIEVTPGTYTLEIDQTIDETGQTIIYTYSATRAFLLSDDPVTYDITVTRQEP